MKTSATNTFGVRICTRVVKSGMRGNVYARFQEVSALPHNKKMRSRSRLKITCIGANSLN